MGVKTETKPAAKVSSPPQINVKIQKLFDGDSKIRALASITIGDAYAVHGIKVINSDKGLFVSMPSSSYKKGGETKYQDIFHPVTAEARQTLNDSIMGAYEKALTEQQSENQSENKEGDDQSIGHVQ